MHRQQNRNRQWQQYLTIPDDHHAFALFEPIQTKATPTLMDLR